MATGVAKSTTLVTKAQVSQMIKSSMAYSHESKYFDLVNQTGVSIDYNGITPVQISAVPQGSTDTSRDGDVIIVKRLKFAHSFRYCGTNTTTNLSTAENVVRLIVFTWKPFFSDVAPVVSAILQYYGAAYGPLSALAHDNRNQFTILFDKTFVLDGFASPFKVVKADLKLNHKIQYKAGSSTNSAGGIFYLYISDATAGGGVYPASVASFYRLDFTDS